VDELAAKQLAAMLGFNSRGSSNINIYLRYGLGVFGALEAINGVLVLSGSTIQFPSVVEVPVIGPPIAQFATAIKSPFVGTLGIGGTDLAYGMAIMWGSGYWKMP
jgi:hypothetical protein